MQEYIHKVQYYETDKMGIVHHSNYIRWFEEARIDYLDKIGISYKSLEGSGFICPVLSVQCNYKKSVIFGTSVKICTVLKSFGNVRFTFHYVVCDPENGEEHACGESTHCFIDSDGKVISLKKMAPELFDCFGKHIDA
ncbi:MAG: acyl-CoA thioesterase [Firmicutes bacterium]|nr:acyl-CoA thioesterase [Bacillota bacterium]